MRFASEFGELAPQGRIVPLGRLHGSPHIGFRAAVGQQPFHRWAKRVSARQCGGRQLLSALAAAVSGGDAADYETINNYCMKDTEIVAEIIRRYREYDGGLNVPF